MEAVKTKRKPLIITLVILLCLAVVTILFIFIYHKQALSRALSDLDIEDESSVIRVMKYGGDDEEILLMLADSYIGAGYYSDASRLLLYTLQYISSDSEQTFDLLKESYKLSGASDTFISSLKPLYNLTEYKLSATLDETSYGIGENGIYTEFLGGYAKAKLAPSRTSKLSACPSGVYFIDLADYKLKLLSRDGSEIKTVLDDKMLDFVDFESYLYYIDINGQPHGPNKITLEEDTFASDMRVEDGQVLCTVFDADYNEIKTIQLS